MDETIDSAVDDALSDYDPGESGADVQDALAQMDNAEVPVIEGPESPQFIQESPQTLDAIARGPAQRSAASILPTSGEGPGVPRQAAIDAFKAGQDTAVAQEGVGAAMQGVNEARAQEYEDAVVQRQLDEQEAADQEAEHAKVLENTHRGVEEAQKKYRDFKFHNMYAEMPTANKIAAVIFSAIGGAMAAKTGGGNQVVKALTDMEEREYHQDLQRLGALKNFAEWKKEGEKDLQVRYEKERSALRVKQSERLKRMADMAQAQYLRSHPGSTVEEAKNDVTVRGLQQAAAEKYAQATRDLYKMELAAANARLRAKRAGAGGSSTALKNYYDAVNALKPGEGITPEVASLGRAAGLKANQISADVDRIRSSGVKSDTLVDKNAEADEKRANMVIKDPWTGETIGPAPSSRSIQVARKDQGMGVQLVDSLKKYKKFLDEKGTRNWKPEDVAMAKNLWADAVSQRRVWSGLPSSEAGLKLEEAQFGGVPVAWDVTPTSGKVIEHMMHEVEDVTRQRANILAGRPANYRPAKVNSETGVKEPPAELVQKAQKIKESGNKNDPDYFKALAFLKRYGK